jgi:hypothetical protein
MKFMVQRSVGAKSFSASQLQKMVSDGKNKHIKYILYKYTGVIQNFWKTLSLNDFAPTDLWTMNFIYTVYEIYFPVTVKFTGKTCDFNKFLN